MTHTPLVGIYRILMMGFDLFFGTLPVNGPKKWLKCQHLAVVIDVIDASKFGFSPLLPRIIAEEEAAQRKRISFFSLTRKTLGAEVLGITDFI